MSSPVQVKRIAQVSLAAIAVIPIVAAAVVAATISGAPPRADERQSLRRAATTDCVQPPDPMIGWWPFDDLEYFDSTHDDGYLDKAGVNNVGEPIAGPMLPITGSHVANAIALNGRDQYIRVADHPELAFGTGDLTIDAWIRIDDDPNARTGRRAIVDKSAPGPSGEPFGYALFIDDGHLGFAMNAITEPLAAALSQAPLGNGWQFVAVTVERTFDRTGGSGKLYINDLPPETFAVAPSGQTTVDNESDLLIGWDDSAFGREAEEHFWGGIDEVELVRRALTPEELGAIYASGPAGKCKEPAYPAIADNPKAPMPLGVQLVNIDVVNQCGADATGFRFVLTGFGDTPDINSTNYGFEDVYEVQCPVPNTAQVTCNPFTPQKAVPIYTAANAGSAGSIVLAWHPSPVATLAAGKVGHFGYTLAPAVNYDAKAQLTIGPSQETLCESVAPSSEWSHFGTTITMTLQNPSPHPMEVVARATVVQRLVSLGELVPSNVELMRSLGEPLASTVLEPSAVQTVTLKIGPTDRTAVVLSDWYVHDGQRGALQARAFHARILDGAIAPPSVRRYFPWAGNMEPPDSANSTREN